MHVWPSGKDTLGVNAPADEAFCSVCAVFNALFLQTNCAGALVSREIQQNISTLLYRNVIYGPCAAFILCRLVSYIFVDLRILIPDLIPFLESILIPLPGQIEI